jgi:recombination protein RecR
LKLPDKLLNSVDQFSKLPGVGEKTALRQSLILTNWSKQELVKFGESISELASLEKCTKCGVFSEGEICEICNSPYRSAEKSLCLVENISDYLAIERSAQFKGVYHILGGVLNPLMGIGPNELNMDKLFSRITSEGIENIILAINPSVEGDATCSYIKQSLGESVDVERIGFGIPIGGSLEYLDEMTISMALENKKRM